MVLVEQLGDDGWWYLQLYKCIMTNTSAIWQQAAHTTYQISSPSCSTRTIQKSLTLNEKYLIFLEKKENAPLAEKWQDRKGKRTRQKNNNNKTREEIGRGNQMTALTFQTGGRHQTSSPPFGAREREREREREFKHWFTTSFLQPLPYLVTP